MQYSTETITYAFLLTVFAGLSTSVGGLIAFTTNHNNKKFLCTALGFSAGVMIYVSFVEIFPKAQVMFASYYPSKTAVVLTVCAFFAGILITALIDHLIPEAQNPHEFTQSDEAVQSQKLLRMGLLCALALSMHNLPEGIATFTAALEDPSLGLVIAIAIAIHNVPEGIAVALPIYQATGSKKKAFWYSTLSGVAEPVGALLCYLFFLPFIDQYPQLIAIIFAAVAGVMVFISLDELLPAAEEFGEHHLSIYGLIAGMAFMAVSLILFI